MPADLASQLLRKAVGSMACERSTCSTCRRTPLPGELLHVFESDRAVCALCLAALPERERAGARPERVHATRQHLAVVRGIAAG
jgi:hypothetical protein